MDVRHQQIIFQHVYTFIGLSNNDRVQRLILLILTNFRKILIYI